MCQHLYTLQNDHNNLVMVTDVSPYKVIEFFSCDKSNFQICSTVSLTIVTKLHITSLWFICFIDGNLYLLIPFTHFAHLPTPLPSGNHRFILCIYEVWFVVLDSTYKWNHMLFVLLWLISCSIILLRSTHVVTRKMSFFFCSQIVLHSLSIPVSLSNHPRMHT